MADDPTSTLRKRDAARTKATILRSAVAEFAQHGPASTRVDEITIRAGVNKSLIYQYFGSKHELYADVLADVLTRATEHFASLAQESVAASETETFQDKVSVFMHGHLRALDAMPEYPRLMAWENLEGGKTLAQPQVRRAFLALLDRLQQMLKGLADRGVKIANADPRHVMLSAMALNQYFVLFKTVSQDVLRVSDTEQGNRDSWVDFCARMYGGLAR